MTEQQEAEFIAWFKEEYPNTFKAAHVKNHYDYIGGIKSYVFARAAWEASREALTIKIPAWGDSVPYNDGVEDCRIFIEDQGFKTEQLEVSKHE